MNRRIAREVINQYDRRGKGSDQGPFVDATRRGAHLEIDKATGHVRQISRVEYEQSPYRKYEDGRPSDDVEDTSGGIGCPDCGRMDCVCDT